MRYEEAFTYTKCFLSINKIIINNNNNNSQH